MKKKMNDIICKMIAGILVCVSVVFAVGCNHGDTPSAPDYSSYTNQFDFFGYSGPSNGQWVAADGKSYYAGESFHTVEQFKAYKDVGMTIYFPQSDGFKGISNFETSDLKPLMDLAEQAGFEKTIVSDSRLLDISRIEGGLIGEGKKFATEEELDEVIANYIKDYKTHPTFYGVMLCDEPLYTMFESYGQTYKSLKRVCPEIFVQMNLLPMLLGNWDTGGFPKVDGDENMNLEEIRMARFKKYLEMYLDATGADYIMYDAYPMDASSIYQTYIPMLQTAAGVARDRGVQLYNVTQTLSFGNERYISLEDAYWLNNILLGFGVKKIAYYTYWQRSSSAKERVRDDSAFITYYGEKTQLYYDMQKIMAEDQKFAPVILNFDYVTNKIYRSKLCRYSTAHVSMALEEDKEFSKVTDVKLNKEIALVTEMYDKGNDRYMYMVQNLIDPLYSGSATYETVELTFGKGYTHAVLYSQGESRIVSLVNGSVTIKQHPGYATWVLPY